MIALDAAGDTDSARAAVKELAADMDKALAQMRQRVERGEVKAEQVARATSEYSSQLSTARLWLGFDTDQVREFLAETAAVLRAWLAIRSGNAAAGREQLEPYVRTSPFALLGVGMSYEVNGEKDQALAYYLRTAREHPLDVTGAWAISRAIGLGFKFDPGSVATLESVVAEVPDFVDRLVQNPQEFEEVRVQAVAQFPDAIDRVGVRLTLQNLSRIPMALGADRPISSRFLIAPKLEASGRLSPKLIQPEVIDIDRRLRLMPQGKLEVELWPDAGLTGWLMECVATRTVRVRWRAIQGFQIAPSGGYLPGVMGLTADTGSLVRLPLAELSLPPEALAARIATEPASILPRLAAAVRASIMQPLFVPSDAPQPKPGEEAAAPRAGGVETAGVAVLAARYTSVPPADRAMLAAVLPHARLAPDMAPVDQAMRAETDPVPLCLVLATRVIDPADELLAKCKDSEDPRVRDMADRVRRRLEAGAKTYAKFSAAEMMPPPAAKTLPGQAPDQPADPALDPGGPNK